MRRRDDRVSRWLIKNVLGMFDEGVDRHVFLKLVALCRFVNWPPTVAVFLELDKPWHKRKMVWKKGIDLPAIGKLLDARVKSGEKAWTGAYMVRAPYATEMTKGEYVAEKVVGAGLDRRQGDLWEAIDARRLEDVWRIVQEGFGWGSFMAGQVIADLTYTRLLDRAEDLYTWAPVGPGSQRGFNRLLGRELEARVEPEEWAYYVPLWREAVCRALSRPYDWMTAHDLQNCLCELDKMLRVKNGEGKPRSLYKPETAY